MAKRCLGCMKAYKVEYELCPYCGYRNGSAPDAPYHIKPGTVIGEKYIIGKSLGYGGFGVTYVGYDEELQRKVAIKEYLPSEFATRTPGDKRLTLFSGDKEEQYKIGLKRFSDEAKRLAKFSSEEGIVREYDIVEENGTAYIVMEYLEGETLKERLDRENKLDEQESVRITVEILRALKKVHSQGIIHRDISPENVFLTKDGKVKLLDFGAARYATAEHSKSLSVLLKPGYAPEEQYRSKGNQGPWSDVYAVGAVLYKMLTGKTPEDAMERSAKDKLKSPIAAGAKISKNLNNAVMNALHIYKEDRTPSAEKFEKELLSAEEVILKTKTIQHTDQKGLARWQKVTGIVLAAAIVLTGGILLLLRAQTPTQTIIRAPELLGMTLEQAQLEAEQYGIKISAEDKITSSKVDPNLVLSQDPQPGEAIQMGQSVKLVISAGNLVEMPDLIGMTEDDAVIPDVQIKSEAEAKKSLEEAGFKVVISYSESETVAEGKVVSQSLSGFAKTGTEITINVSTGKTYTVPNVVGLSKDDAIFKLQSLGIYGKTTEKNDNSATPGTVISQSVSAGSEITDKTVVNIVICKATSASSTTSISTSSEVTSAISSATSKTSSVASWSDWMLSLPAEVKNNQSAYEINSRIAYYEYSTKDTTTATTSTLAGWTLDNSATQTEYGQAIGDPSPWTENPITQTQDIVVESKTQYGYCEKEYSTSDSSSKTGWTLYKTETIYGDWVSAGTTTEKPEESDTVKITNTTTTYSYFHWCNYYNSHWWVDSIKYGSQSIKHTTTTTSPLPKANDSSYEDKGGNEASACKGPACPYGYLYWWLENTTTKYQYSTRTKSIVYYYYKYSDPVWSFDSPTSSGDYKVLTRTVYRFYYREKVYHYSFYRITTGLTSKTYPQNAYGEVKTIYEYQYRKK